MLEHKGPQVTKETNVNGSSESTAPDCKHRNATWQQTCGPGKQAQAHIASFKSSEWKS